MAATFPCPLCGNPVNAGFTVCGSCGASKGSARTTASEAIEHFSKIGIGAMLLAAFAAHAVAPDNLAFYFLGISLSWRTLFILGAAGFFALIVFARKMPESDYWARRK